MAISISALCDIFDCFFLRISCMATPPAIPDLVDLLTDDMRADGGIAEADLTNQSY